ncbi:phospho-N-acetylmuramoyl-pentapeptide-transferase [Clostridium folliculivorans]|uniref:Phospho-N-acetylmuramoyl-pentapeptide-transferase n=1 Tax=Clostridium folliculivorans TaxID=2886038 RepID=A0A9W5Y160_9CLOT|nr:phospho-N-acetylmuramoyl-pentapeptide-transferase [Clostridium folliculivorans]GKU24686.1 phospho-N-acetylmuramoyl-pentapeptide-transferase [Clostridium folliculivorans]
MFDITTCIIFSFLLSIIIGRLIIPALKKENIGQYIRDEQPKAHLKKAGTPIFGGFIFIISTVVTSVIMIKDFNNEVMFVILSFLIFGTIGFLDDVLKTFKKKNEGLNVLQKLILILLGASYLIYFANKNLNVSDILVIPFTLKNIHIGIFYIPFILFFYTCVTNAVNLTDGLDGLAGTVTMLIAIFFTSACLLFDKNYLAIVCSSLFASLIGFLRFNIFPAKIIMGDTGSLALGGFVASIAIVLKLPLIIPIVGGVYLIETLTTFIQIIVFKISGKRVFKMTPIHHSFELSGFHETRIVTMFSLTTAVLCIIGYLSLINIIQF